MTILSDGELRTTSRNIICPFHETQITKNSREEKIISYGLSSYGYDIRCSEKFLLSTDTGMIVDPKDSKSHNYVQYEAHRKFLLLPGTVALTNSLEYIRVPNNCLGMCIGKSTYARCGLIINTTPLEPEWEGYLTIEISNTNNSPVYIYPFEGIAQLLFIKTDRVCEVSYKDRQGKYQNQENMPIFSKI